METLNPTAPDPAARLDSRCSPGASAAHWSRDRAGALVRSTPEALMRSLWLLLLVWVVGCSSPARPVEDAAALANLRDQAAAVGRAMVQEDHQRMVDLTHPALIEQFGGRAASVRKLQDIAAELRQQGLRFEGFQFGTPSQLVDSGGTLYAVFPYTLELTLPDGRAAGQPSYLVCASTDRGSTWRFLDGSGIKGERSRLERLLPGFPAELALPDPQPPAVRK
jgi:hypothetical protein